MHSFVPISMQPPLGSAIVRGLLLEAYVGAANTASNNAANLAIFIFYSLKITWVSGAPQQIERQVMKQQA